MHNYYDNCSVQVDYKYTNNCMLVLGKFGKDRQL